jgi:hypothetical protein
VLGKHFEVLWGCATSGLASFLVFVGVFSPILYLFLQPACWFSSLVTFWFLLGMYVICF